MLHEERRSKHKIEAGLPKKFLNSKMTALKKLRVSDHG